MPSKTYSTVLKQSLTTNQRAQVEQLVTEQEAINYVDIDVGSLIGTAKDRDGWSKLRLKLGHFCECRCFDLILLGLLVCNFFIVIRETDEAAICAPVANKECPSNDLMVALNSVLLTLFVLEVAMKIYVYRSMYWLNSWNILDFSVITACVFFEFLETIHASFAVVRLMRLFRLARLFHLMVNFKPLYMIVMGVCSCFQSLFWACILLAFVVTIWSVIMVTLLHPIAMEIAMSDPAAFGTCTRCPKAFSSVKEANLTLLQTVVMGDSWGQVCLPLIEHSPWVLGVFSSIIASVGFCICNLILATVVHSAEEAKNNDVDFMARARKAFDEQQRQRLVELCMELDTDASGTLTYEELVFGYQHSGKFTAVFQSLGLSLEDLRSVLAIADGDRNGDVDYIEFIDLILDMKATDTKSLVMLMRQDLMDFRAKVCFDIEEVLRVLRPAGSGDVKVRHARRTAHSYRKSTRASTTSSKFRHLGSIASCFPQACSEDDSSDGQGDTAVAQNHEEGSCTKDSSTYLPQHEPGEAIDETVETIDVVFSDWEPIPPSTTTQQPVEREPSLSSPPRRNEHLSASETRQMVDEAEVAECHLSEDMRYQSDVNTGSMKRRPAS